MKRALVFAFLPCIALAQTQPDPRVEATVSELIRGRDVAVSALMNEAAALRADLTLARKDLEAAKKAAEACKPAEEKK